MTAKVSINSIILRNIWISIENFTPYSNWVVDKEVITKRCFRFRVEAQRSLWNLRCENPQCMDKKASMKKLHKGMTTFLVSNHRNQSSSNSSKDMFSIYEFCYHKTYMYMALVGRTLQEHHKHVDNIKVKFS
jgi:hypothetical protein